ncbi:MAG: glycosyltransferase family 4 protein [Candidatus Micrarchaeota archaeon]|nr:glycosyltransferase family 4 protein [Candidatus Micrarchaeota archaeon]
MKVAMLGWEFPPFISGGLGVHCFELTRALCRMGVEIDFFMPVSGKEISAPFPGLRIIEVAKTSLRPYLSFSKSGRKADYGKNLIAAVNEYWERCYETVELYAKSQRYDLIHAHDWLTSRAGIKLREGLRLPLVQTFHSTEYDRTSWPWDYILEIERSAAANADLIIAVSKRTKQQVMRLGADEQKIRVVYNGVDKKKFEEAKAQAKALDELKKKKKIVLFLGRLTEQKGPVQFLHAAKRVLAKNPDVLFIVAGKGELLPLLINMTLDLGISQNVRFLGYVPEEDQKRIYKIADVYVMPSTSEPFGITALEAMSAGVPVIISKTSGVAEIVKSAIKVDFWDINAMATKILAVLSHEPLRKTMTAMSCKEVEYYTWSRTAEETLRVYNEAISKSPFK